MSSISSREQARQRLDAIYQSLRDKLIPADESVPLAGGKFLDWEDQADLIERELCTVFLEERAALEMAAQVSSGGICPQCHSSRVYLMKEESKVEVQSTHGPVVLRKQRCRCRSCGRSFSPSGARLDDAHRGGVDTKSRGENRPRGGDGGV